MKTPLSPAEVHKQYEEGVSTFIRSVPDAGLRVRLGRDLDAFFQSCALGVWKADGASLTPGYVEYYNAIYLRGNPAPSILYWELGTSVANYPGFRPPESFGRMRAWDKVAGAGLARRFIDLFTLMALLFAAVDGVVSEGEAGFVNRCADALSSLCDKDGLAGGKTPLDAKDFVTARPAPAQGVPEKPEEPVEQKEPEPTVDELMAQLDELCGLTQVKADVKSLINLVKVRKLREG